MLRRTDGFTLVELLIAATIVAIVIPSAIQVLEGMSRASVHAEKRIQAYLIAKGYMEEILVKRFDESQSSPWSGTLGLDAGENLTSNTDDVDDYHNGTRFFNVSDAASTADDYRAVATVDYVTPPTGMGVATHSDPQTECKRIRVEVRDASGNVWATVKSIVSSGGNLL